MTKDQKNVLNQSIKDQDFINYKPKALTINSFRDGTLGDYNVQVVLVDSLDYATLVEIHVLGFEVFSLRTSDFVPVYVMKKLYGSIEHFEQVMKFGIENESKQG